MSVQDHRSRTAGRFVAQSAHEPLVTADLNERVKLSDKTTARLTYPISRDYGLAVVVEGYLDDRSTKRLVVLYSELAPEEKSVQPRTKGALKLALGPAAGGGAVEDATTRLKSLRVGMGGGQGSFMSARMGEAYARGR